MFSKSAVFRYEKTASRLTAIFMPRCLLCCLTGANILTKIETRFNSVYLLSNFKILGYIMEEKDKLYLRLKQAIIWLKNKDILQKDIAAKMEMSTVGFSRGVARCKEKYDEDFVIKSPISSLVASRILIGIPKYFLPSFLNLSFSKHSGQRFSAQSYFRFPHR